MAPPARQRILDAAAHLLREKGIARLTTREIAVAADAAEGSITKNFGGKLGLLTTLLSSELPELASWRAALTPPTACRDDLRTTLITVGDKAIDYYAASLPLVAGAVSDVTLLDAYRATNSAKDTGPQLAMETMATYLDTWQATGALSPDADTWALALTFCGAAQLQVWTEYLAGPGSLPRDRNARIQAVVAALIP